MVKSKTVSFSKLYDSQSKFAPLAATLSPKDGEETLPPSDEDNASSDPSTPPTPTFKKSSNADVSASDHATPPMPTFKKNADAQSLLDTADASATPSLPEDDEPVPDMVTTQSLPSPPSPGNAADLPSPPAIPPAMPMPSVDSLPSPPAADGGASADDRLSKSPFTPDSAEDRLRSMGVSSPQVPGVNVLPSGESIMVTQRHTVNMQQISSGCLAALKTPGVAQAIINARNSAKSVMRSKTASAVDQLQRDLTALVSNVPLQACDSVLGTSGNAVLDVTKAWGESQQSLATAMGRSGRAEKALGAAQSALDAAQAEQTAADAAVLTEKDVAARASAANAQQLQSAVPQLYKSLKRWADMAASSSG